MQDNKKGKIKMTETEESSQLAGNEDDNDDYKFLPLADALISLNQKVNLVGVILEYGIPRKSKGTDYFVSLKIVDESYQGHGITVNVFAESKDKLPCVRSCGDIIQLTHVMMKVHDRDVYVLFNKKLSSFALFEGKYGKDLLPYQISRKFYHGNNAKKFIDSFRKWLADHHLDQGTKESVSLKELKQKVGLDLVCKILHVWEFSQNEWMAFVWDGNDTPPLAIETGLENEKSHKLPLHLEPSPLQRDVMCSFPTVGTTLRVIAAGGTVKPDLGLLIAGKWVRFLNVIFEVNAGLWRGVLKPYAKVLYVSNDDPVVFQRQRFYEERVSTKLNRIPQSSLDGRSPVTVTDHNDAPFVTLADVLAFPKPTAKFKCMVRVVAIFPWKAEDFCCTGTYLIRLTLEDPTARIHALVYGEDGGRLMEGRPPIEVLKKKRNKLLGVVECGEDEEIKDAPRNPPWTQCCLKSYYRDKNDKWGSRQYQVSSMFIVACPHKMIAGKSLVD